MIPEFWEHEQWVALQPYREARISCINQVVCLRCFWYSFLESQTLEALDSLLFFTDLGEYYRASKF